jgi:hypothetical protein
MNIINPFSHSDGEKFSHSTIADIKVEFSFYQELILFRNVLEEDYHNVFKRQKLSSN